MQVIDAYAQGITRETHYLNPNKPITLMLSTYAVVH